MISRCYYNIFFFNFIFIDGSNKKNTSITWYHELVCFQFFLLCLIIQNNVYFVYSVYQFQVLRFKHTFFFQLGDDEKLKLQQQEATRRENVLLMRLATKEQEMQEFLVCNILMLVLWVVSKSCKCAHGTGCWQWVYTVINFMNNKNCFCSFLLYTFLMQWIKNFFFITFIESNPRIERKASSFYSSTSIDAYWPSSKLTFRKDENRTYRD